MMARAHLFIKGRVQGVGYRAFTRKIAENKGLRGWIRNVPGGDVEVVFEGDQSLIEAAIKKCSEGPPFSFVSEVDVSWTDLPEGLKDFTVRY